VASSERNDGCYTQHGGDVLRRRGIIKAYYRVESADAVVQAVLSGRPVVFASPWYNSMARTYREGTSETRWIDVDPASGIMGYHAYLIDGADNTSVEDARARVHNSWGVTWGNKGSAWITLDELRILWMNQAFIADE